MTGGRAAGLLDGSAVIRITASKRGRAVRRAGEAAVSLYQPGWNWPWLKLRADRKCQAVLPIYIVAPHGYGSVPAGMSLSRDCSNTGFGNFQLVRTAVTRAISLPSVFKRNDRAGLSALLTGLRIENVTHPLADL